MRRFVALLVLPAEEGPSENRRPFPQVRRSLRVLGCPRGTSEAPDGPQAEAPERPQTGPQGPSYNPAHACPAPELVDRRCAAVGGSLGGWQRAEAFRVRDSHAGRMSWQEGWQQPHLWRPWAPKHTDSDGLVMFGGDAG